MPAHRKWTDEQLVAAVAASRSVAEVCRRLGLKQAYGGTNNSVAVAITKLGLDTEHFWGRGLAKGRTKTQEQLAASLSKSLVLGVPPVGQLGRKLIRAGLLEAKCYRAECGITEWLGKSAPLQLDHKNGNRLDNRLENLWFLCANCHQQTETWGFRGKKYHTDVTQLAEVPDSEPG